MRYFCLPRWPAALLCVLGLGALTWARQGAQNSTAPTNSSKYVGAETCQACHDDLYQSIANSAHEKLLTSKDPVKQGCEGCHGAGAEHVNGNGDASKIFRFGAATAAVVREHCLACHVRQKSDSQKMGCLDCHSVHHYQQKKAILVKSEDKLCISCHDPLGNSKQARHR